MTKDRLCLQELSRFKNFARSRSSMNPDIVREIRKLENLSNSEIAAMFNTTSSTVYAIRNYRTWKDVI